MNRYERINFTRPAAEMLEDRIAPATLPLLDLSNGDIMGTFTDADGDRVTVRIEGHAGKVEFRDAGGNSVDDGDNIGSVIITGSSADFVLTFTQETSGTGANTVNMGDITANKVLNGIFSIPANGSTGSFTLGSFVGPGFSAGGGLSADDVAGNADGLGMQLNSLPANRSINIRNSFAGDLLILGSLGGSIAVGGDVTETSAWQINKTVTPTAQITVHSNFAGSFEARSTFAGNVEIGSSSTGAWTFQKDVLKSATLGAGHWHNIQASKNWGGQLFATATDLTMSVGGNILGTSVFNVQNRLNLAVEGNVQSGAVFGTSSDMTATVGGNVSGKWTSSGDVTLTVGGGISGASITTGGEMVLTVAKGILKSQAQSNSEVTLSTAGTVTSTIITAASQLVAEVSGNIVDSVLEGTDANLTISVGGNLTDTRVTSGFDPLTLGVEGNVSRSTITSLHSDVQLTVGGSLVDADVRSGNDLIGTIARNVVRSSFDANEPIAADTNPNVGLTIMGDFVASKARAEGNLNLAVSGRVAAASFTSMDASATLTIGKDVAGSRIEAAQDLSLSASGRLIGSELINGEGRNLAVQVGLDAIASHISSLNGNVILSVGRHLLSSAIKANSEALIEVLGSISKSQISTASNLSLSVGQNVTNSKLASAESDVFVSVDGNFLESSISCDEDIEISVTGNLSGVLDSASSGVTMTVGGTMRGHVIAGEEIVADIGQLEGTLAGRRLDLLVQQNVGAGARIQANNIDDINSDTIGFRINGSFAGQLTTLDFDSDAAGSSQLVGGDVLKSARFNIAGQLGGTADESFEFGGDFLGVLNVGGDIDVNLVFNGDVNQVIIGGLVGTTGAVNTIIVNGKLNFLSTGSLFEETTPGKAGSFLNGLGTETATLQIESKFTTVIPIL
jgi:hypothetical protein